MPTPNRFDALLMPLKKLSSNVCAVAHTHTAVNGCQALPALHLPTHMQWHLRSHIILSVQQTHTHTPPAPVRCQPLTPAKYPMLSHTYTHVHTHVHTHLPLVAEFDCAAGQVNHRVPCKESAHAAGWGTGGDVNV